MQEPSREKGLHRSSSRPRAATSAGGGCGGPFVARRGTFRPLAHGAGSISETIPSTDTQVANLPANQTEVAAATPSASGSIGTGYWSMSTEELANRGLAERAESDYEQNNVDITMTLDVDDEVDDVYVDEQSDRGHPEAVRGQARKPRMVFTRALGQAVKKLVGQKKTLKHFMSIPGEAAIEKIRADEEECQSNTSNPHAITLDAVISRVLTSVNRNRTKEEGNLMWPRTVVQGLSTAREEAREETRARAVERVENAGIATRAAAAAYEKLVTDAEAQVEPLQHQVDAILQKIMTASAQRYLPHNTKTLQEQDTCLEALHTKIKSLPVVDGLSSIMEEVTDARSGLRQDNNGVIEFGATQAPTPQVGNTAMVRRDGTGVGPTIASQVSARKATNSQINHKYNARTSFFNHAASLPTSKVDGVQQTVQTQISFMVDTDEDSHVTSSGKCVLTPSVVQSMRRAAGLSAEHSPTILYELSGNGKRTEVVKSDMQGAVDHRQATATVGVGTEVAHTDAPATATDSAPPAEDDNTRAASALQDIMAIRDEAVKAHKSMKDVSYALQDHVDLVQELDERLHITHVNSACKVQLDHMSEIAQSVVGFMQVEHCPPDTPNMMAVYSQVMSGDEITARLRQCLED